LMGGLFGFHSGNSAVQTYNMAAVSGVAKQYVEPIGNATVKQTAVQVKAYSLQEKTIPVSYSVPADYIDDARQAAISAGISPDYFVRQIQQESGFNPGAVSPAGAVGIAQFMPATAASMGVDPNDPVQALNGAARLMASFAAQFGGDYSKALAAYNAGPGAVQGAVNTAGGNWLAYMPAETQNYVAVIMG
jgi:soluble lytic murein transglycosylase-like protein